MALYDSKQTVDEPVIAQTICETNTENLIVLRIDSPGKYKVIYGGMTNRSGGGTLSVYFESGFSSTLIASTNVTAYSASSVIDIDTAEAYLTPGISMLPNTVTLKASPIGSSIWYKGFLTLVKVE